MDMLAQKSPNVVSKIQFTPDPEVKIIIELNTENFFLGLTVTNYLGSPIVN